MNRFNRVWSHDLASNRSGGGLDINQGKGSGAMHPGSSGGDGRGNIPQGPKHDTHKGNKQTPNPNNVKVEDPLKKFKMEEPTKEDLEQHYKLMPCCRRSR